MCEAENYILTFMDKIGGSRAGPGGEVLMLHETRSEPVGSGIERDVAAGGPAADDEHGEGLSRSGARQRRMLRNMRMRHRPGLGDTLPFSLKGQGRGVRGGCGQPGCSGSGNDGGGSEGGGPRAAD
jgi:hypothetical protein